MVRGEPAGPGHRGEVLVHVRLEVGRVVGVHRGQQGLVEHRGQLGDLHAVGDPAVGDRADGQPDPVGGQPRHQRGVLQAVDAVVDPLHADLVQALPDVPDRVLLVDVAVHGEPVALGPRPGEHGGELQRRIAPLVGVQAYPHDLVRVGEGRRKRLHRRVGRQVAQEAHDQLRPQPELIKGVAAGPVEPADDGRERHTPAGVRLRVEEHLRVHHALRARAPEVRHREVVEVGFDPQDLHARVVADQERGEVVERRHVRHRDAVPYRQFRAERSFQGALDVQVQLGLRQPGDERVDGDRHAAVASADGGVAAGSWVASASLRTPRVASAQ
jgi:hypothetical protein